MPEIINTATFTTVFEDGILKVYENSEAYTDRLAIVQPFRPSTDGTQNAWTNEQEALDWWDSQKNYYGPPSINVPEEETTESLSTDISEENPE